jgi:DNA invertase Pin-like site-specific DNA recombinase
MSPHQGKFIAYFRVSTDKQGKSGLGLEAQRKAVLDYLDGGRWSLVQEFVEVESGKHNERPQLTAALAACKKHKAKLVIAKLDRLSRNLAFIAALMESGVEFVAVDNPHATKLTVHILAAVAEHEREMISERTRAALRAAKARGTRLGNPQLAKAAKRGTAAVRANARRFAANVLPIIEEIERAGVTSHNAIAAKLNERGTRLGNPQLAKAAKRGTAAVRANARRFAANVLPIIEEIERAGVTSHNAIAAKLNERNVRTARGGKWTHVQVGAVLRPFEASGVAA